MKALLLLTVVIASASPALARPALSRVYVNAYPCAANGRTALRDPGKPLVTLYDRRHYGDASDAGLHPVANVTASHPGESDFYFDVSPGSYHAFVEFPGSNRTISMANGPLIVIAGYDRHLFIAGCGLTDWHAVAAVAGKLPLRTVTVRVLHFERPMRCGDDIYALDQKTLQPRYPYQRTEAVIDDGAYYGVFHGYGWQNRTVALEFSGALFTRGAVLVTNAPRVPFNRPPLLLKDVTPAIIEAAARAGGDLVCVRGF